MKSMNLKKKLGVWAVLASMVVGALGAMPASASDVPDNMLSRVSQSDTPDNLMAPGPGDIPECSWGGPQKLGPGQSCKTELRRSMAVAVDLNFTGKSYLEVSVSPGGGKCPLLLKSHQTGSEFNLRDDTSTLTGLKGIHLVTMDRDAVADRCAVTFVGK